MAAARKTRGSRPRAATYRRISDDREGRELGVERQAEDLERLATERGYEVTADFVDNDRGASTRSRKPRPDYQRLIQGARAGSFDVILAYTTSRLTRRPREHEDLIELAERHGVTFAFVKSPEFDLGTAAGRKMARILAASDAGESEDIAERVKRAAEQRAERGEWHGGPRPPFGYRLVRGAGRDARLKLELHAGNATLLREAADRVLAGEAMYAVCTDWNRRGLQTQGGSHWQPSTLRRALLAPAAVGRRARTGENESAARVAELHGTRGWEPVLADETWERLHELMALPSRRTFTPVDGSYAGKRTLSRLVACGRCGRTMVTHTMRGRPRAVCDKLASGGCGKVVIDYESLEGYVAAQLFARVGQPDYVDALRERRESSDTERTALRQELRSLDAERQRVAEAYELGWRTKAEVADRMDDIDKQRNDAQRRLDGLAAAHVLDDVDFNELPKLWETADVTRKRRLAASLVRRVVVHPHPKGWTTTLTRRTRQGETQLDFDFRKAVHAQAVLERRVEIEWRDGVVPS